MKKEMKPENIRMAGWVLIFSVPTFILGMYWESSVWDLWIPGFPMVLLSIPMMAFGVRGIQARYGNVVGSFGINILQFGVILGQITSLIGFVGCWFINSLFLLIYMGPAIILTCLTIFGLMALFKSPLMSWKPLTIFAAIWYPVFCANQLIDWFTSERTPAVPFDNSDLLIMAIPGIAMIVLGYMLQSDVPQEMTPA